MCIKVLGTYDLSWYAHLHQVKDACVLSSVAVVQLLLVTCFMNTTLVKLVPAFI